MSLDDGPRLACEHEIALDRTTVPCGAGALGVAYAQGKVYPACASHAMTSPQILLAWIRDHPSAQEVDT